MVCGVLKGENMKLSIVVPLYKGRCYVKKWVEKGISNEQFLQNKGVVLPWEIIFVNDYPEEQIEIPLDKIPLHIKVYNLEKNRGIHGARVFGYSMAKGEYIVFLDQDDSISDDYIFSQIKSVGDNDAVVANGYRKRFCRNGKGIIYGTEEEQKGAINIDRHIYTGCGILSPGQVMIKKSAIPKIWIHNILKTNGVDDYFLWLLMLKGNRKMGINQEKIYTHIGHGDNTSSSYNRMSRSIVEMLDVLRREKILSEEEIRAIKERKCNEQTNKFSEIMMIYDYWVCIKNHKKQIDEYLMQNEYNRIAIYGMSYLGNRLYEELVNSNVEVVFGVDRDADKIEYDIPIYKLKDIKKYKDEIDVVIVTTVLHYEEIKEQIFDEMEIPIVSMKEIVVDMCKNL